MVQRTKKVLALILPFVAAMVALILTMGTVSWARDALPTDHSSPPPAPLARPHEPNSGVYTLYDTLTPADAMSVTYEWIETRDSADYEWSLGGRYSGHGDVSAPYPIGFFFPFYADFYTHFRISEKGYILFEKPGVDVGSGRGRPNLIPSNNLTGTDAANNLIAPFADDLYGYPGISRVYVRNDSSPRRTIIEFENLVWCCGLYNPRTFQIILYPSGDIKMQYLKITNFAGTLDEDLNKTVVVGLENLDASAGDVYTQGTFIPSATDVWQDQMAIRFVSNFTGVQAVFLPSSRVIWDDPGNSITTTSNLYLGARETVTRSFYLTHSLSVSSSVPITDWVNGITYPTFVSPFSGTYSQTLQFVVAVPVTVTDFNDMATITFTANSTNTTPPISATFTLTYGPAHRDLQIAKTLDPDIPPAVGGALRYRLVITNTDYASSERAATAHGVLVTDVLPAGVTYEDCHRAPYYGGCGSAVTTSTIGTQTVITVSLGTMGIDEVERVWLEVRNHNASGDIGNAAHVTTTQNVELGDGPNNHSNITFTVASITMTELYINKDYPYNDDFIAAGQAIPYNVYFYNDGRAGHTGNGPIYSATIVDLLPENTTFERADLSYDGPQLLPDAEGPITPTIGDPVSRTLTFAIPFVDNGSWNDARLRIWVNVPQTTPIGTRLTNAVTISHGTDTASAGEVVEVASNYVDPFIDKEPSRDEAGYVISPGPGLDYTYWITYGNRSMLTDAYNVVITDTLPPSVTLLSVSPASYLTGPVTSTLPNGSMQLTWSSDTHIPIGGTGQIAVIVHVDENVRRGTKLANQIAITYTGAYTPSTTADDTKVVTVEVASDLEGSQKLVDNPTPSAGDSIQYTIVVSNANLTNTVSFTVSDVLPAGQLAYAGHDLPSTGNVVTGPNSILWTGDAISNSEAALTFQATVTETATTSQVIRNTAYITGAYITGGEIGIVRWMDVTVARGVFGSSGKAASASEVASGETFTYTITARNTGSASGAVTVTDSLPPSVTLGLNSFSPASEVSNITMSGDNRVFTWTTSVDPGSKPLNFRVTVTEGLADGVTVENVAFLDDGFSPAPFPLPVTVTISNPPTIYLPIMFKNWT